MKRPTPIALIPIHYKLTQCAYGCKRPIHPPSEVLCQVCFDEPFSARMLGYSYLEQNLTNKERQRLLEILTPKFKPQASKVVFWPSCWRLNRTPKATLKAAWLRRARLLHRKLRLEQGL